MIALVLLFTLKYLELFSPPLEIEETESEKTKNSTTDPFFRPTKNALNKKDSVVNSLAETQRLSKNQRQSEQSSNVKISKVEEKTTYLETSLYNAAISSLGGGTLREFQLKNHFTQDSLSVNLINNWGHKNLLLNIKDLDGKILDLTTPWSLEGFNLDETTKDSMFLKYKIEVFPGSFLRKTLVFIPQSYTIKVFCDFSEIKDKVFRDVSLSWNNSLATTEKDTVDDLTYFKSYIYLLCLLI